MSPRVGLGEFTRWNSWTLCAPALCAAATRCLSLSTCHCPGNYTAAGNPIRSWARRERPTFQGKATGRDGTEDRSRWKTGRWRDPLSLAAGLDPNCTVTETGPYRTDDPGRAGAGAATRPAYPWPNVCRWRGKSTGCSPWRPRQRTVADRVLGAASPGRGTHWWSSSFSSTWRVGSGTKPGETESESWVNHLRNGRLRQNESCLCSVSVSETMEENKAVLRTTIF